MAAASRAKAGQTQIILLGISRSGFVVDRGMEKIFLWDQDRRNVFEGTLWNKPNCNELSRNDKHTCGVDGILTASPQQVLCEKQRDRLSAATTVAMMNSS